MGCCDGTVLTSPNFETLMGLVAQVDDLAARADLEARGAAVDQTTAGTLESRWLQFIRDAGSGSPPHASWRYLGGDVTDCALTSGGDIAWVGADWFAGTAIVTGTGAPDTYAGAALPFRNGVILEQNPGSFTGATQLTTGDPGDPNVWLSAVEQGGLPAGTHWWPIAAVDDGGTLRVACWHVDGTAPTPYGTLLDSHIVSTNVFGGYASHVALGLGALTDRFWVDGLLRDSTHTYVYGEQFVPDYDANDGGGQPNYGQGDLTGSHTVKRVARVLNGQLLTVANWEFWNGSGWVSGVTNAVPMVDAVCGCEIRGDAGVKKLTTDRYLLVAHQLIDSHVTVYRASAPQGPWTPISRVPVPVQGHGVPDGAQIGQLTKVLPAEVQAPPVEHSIAMISRNVLGVSGTAGRSTRRYAPQFVVVPHL